MLDHPEDMLGACLKKLALPAVSAKIVEAARTAKANGAALNPLPKGTRRNPALYPGPEIYARGEWPHTIPNATQCLRDRIRTEIASA